MGTIERHHPMSGADAILSPRGRTPAAEPGPYATPRWLGIAETVVVRAAFALLALVLLGGWLTLMQANSWA